MTEVPTADSYRLLDLSRWDGDKFESRAAVWEELKNPTADYTVLLPTQNDLWDLWGRAVEQKAEGFTKDGSFEDALLDSLLLHIVVGRYTVQDIHDKASDSRCGFMHFICAVCILVVTARVV